MKIFLDTADVNEIRRLNDLGIVDGVTTNPSLVQKIGKNFKEVVTEICQIVDGPISAEVVCTDFDGMMKEAEVLASLHKNVVVKIPMTQAGIKTIKALSAKGIKTNCTLIFSANQALLAAKNGATYVSPFIGRLDDIGQSGMDLIEEIRTIYDNYDFETQILAASIRHPDHVKESAKAGADVATCPPSVIDKLFKHSLTDSGLKSFLDDWAKIPEELRRIL
ncbi:fructose-6-phosphate aldolase [Candidatus Woesearchaeota archaeon CG10_big_fil_rev_8_21_14_0_10_34_8]|nr:MAG: fructose-6-phosphate aldolase [Candidatus Woesearchaeota archaeon CG10_big_fil_rev_8_21_14_0_10_34_8]